MLIFPNFEAGVQLEIELIAIKLQLIQRQTMSSRRSRRERVPSTGRSNANNYDKMKNGELRPTLIKPDTPVSQRRFEEPVSQRNGLGELDKRHWCESARRAETPPEIPRRIGSIASGGVDGFGYVRPGIKVNPVKIGNMAGVPAIFQPNHHLLSPGRPWWERERFQQKKLYNSARSTRTNSRPPSPVINLIVMKKLIYLTTH